MSINLKHHIIAFLGYVLALAAGILFAAIERSKGNEFEIEKLTGFLGTLIGMYISGIFLSHWFTRNSEQKEVLGSWVQRNRQVIVYLGSVYAIPLVMFLVISFRAIKNA